MKHKRQKGGFSLTEVLMAVGILAVGMLFIAGVFPVAIHFSTVAAERTIAAVAADEAFAKIQLYGFDTNFLTSAFDNVCYDYSGIPFKDSSVPIEAIEFEYPSINDGKDKKYFWSALCKNLYANSVQVTVFVSRKISPNLLYRTVDLSDNSTWPRPVKVEVDAVFDNDELVITGGLRDETFINDGYTLIDDVTGGIYRVLERYSDAPDTVQLDRDWEGISGTNYVWVIPPAVNGGGKYPCVGVFQKIIKF